MYDTIIEIEMLGEIPIASVGNEVDIANASTLERYLDAAAANRSSFVLSLERCRYIDSSGLRPIIRLAERIGPGFFIVVPPKTHVRRVFDLAALHERMNVCATREEALAKASRIVLESLAVL